MLFSLCYENNHFIREKAFTRFSPESCHHALTVHLSVTGAMSNQVNTALRRPYHLAKRGSTGLGHGGDATSVRSHCSHSWEAKQGQTLGKSLSLSRDVPLPSLRGKVHGMARRMPLRASPNPRQRWGGLGPPGTRRAEPMKMCLQHKLLKKPPEIVQGHHSWDLEHINVCGMAHAPREAGSCGTAGPALVVQLDQSFQRENLNTR